MHPVLIFALKVIRTAYLKGFRKPFTGDPRRETDPVVANQAIHELLSGPTPCMIARFGATELTCVANYLAVKEGRRQWWNYITGQSQSWWWNPPNIEQMRIWSGFFPPEIPAIEKFCQKMVDDVPYVDLLGSWLEMENLFENELANARKVQLELLDPYFSDNHWTKALEGKKVLVIHPFETTIQSQYKKRTSLFPNNLLPEFELKTIRAVQSIAGEKTEFKDWFAALDSMTQAMDREDYDICLIGCGAYGFPLAAHAKRQGKKGFHLGGSLQLLFGIRGKRWENPANTPGYNYTMLMNEHWVRPGAEERPKNAHKAEGATYW